MFEWVTDKMIAASIKREASTPDVPCNRVCIDCRDERLRRECGCDLTIDSISARYFFCWAHSGS